jgi:hypothetical protein
MITFPQKAILSAKAATGIGSAILVENFDHIGLTLASDTNATFTVKVQGSQQNTLPAFESAQSATNQWDYVQVKDLEDGSAIDGDTGIAFTDDDVRQFEVNTNGLRWVNVVVTAYTDGKIYCWAKGFAITGK